MIEIEIVILVVVAALFAVRLNALRRLWRLPAKNGEELFLAARVPPGFYAGAGAPGAQLLRQYHRALLVPFAIDVPLGVLLLASGRSAAALYEQFIAMILTSIAGNAVVAHFSYRVRALAGGGEAGGPTAVHLSMAPRRLRDHTHWLAKEFPSRPPVAGRLLAGGLLCFDREAPGVLVRSARGVAINLAQPATYLWAAYLAGLVALAAWQAAQVAG